MDLDQFIPAAFSAMEAFGRGAMSVFLAIPIALALAAAVWFIRHVYRFVQRQRSGELAANIARVLDDDAVLAGRTTNRTLGGADVPERSTHARDGSHD